MRNLNARSGEGTSSSETEVRFSFVNLQLIVFNHRPVIKFKFNKRISTVSSTELIDVIVTPGRKKKTHTYIKRMYKTQTENGTTV